MTVPSSVCRRWQVIATGVLIALASALTSAAPAEPPSPESVVRAFNAAITARKLDEALDLLGEGGVQFNLRAVHGFAADTGASPLTSDLIAQWRAVGTVLFASTRSYRREVLAATAHSQGDLAIVWAQVRATSQRVDAITASSVTFAEAYLLQRRGDRWKIIGMASDRPTR